MDFSTLHYDENYNPTRTSRSICSYARSLNFQTLTPVMQRNFDPSWVAWQVIVNGKAGRRVGCILENDNMRYVVFDLDHPEEEGSEAATEAEDSMVVDE
jgi:anaphase-promoting complex subunit 4